jgi:hypothetical protein
MRTRFKVTSLGRLAALVGLTGTTPRGALAGVAFATGIGLVLGAAACGSSDNQKSGNPETPGDDGGGADASVSCVPGDTKACTSFTIPTGVTVQLGPYGAQMDGNVGQGFENALQMGDTPDAGAFCATFSDIFAQDPKLTAQLLNTTVNGMTLDFSLYTVYRPATWPTSGPIPVITWGNGTCAQPEGYGALLRYVASYGFFIVAANSREVGSGSPQPMLHALDYAAAANADPTSPYYGKLDLTKIGAMGHSQGGGATASAAMDPRVKDVIIFNADDSAVKPFLAISGDMDITGFTPKGMASAVASAPAPGAWLYFHMVPDTGNLNGHLTLMLQPQRVTEPARDWWQMVFNTDPNAKAEFLGTNCGLCNDTADHEFGEHLDGTDSGAPDSGADAGGPPVVDAGGPGEAGTPGDAAGD